MSRAQTKRGVASASCPRLAASRSIVAVAPRPIGAAQSVSARSLLVLGADGCAPFSEGSARLALFSATIPEETAAALSLGLVALSAASPRRFFNRRADPSLAHPLLNGVELQSQRVGDLCRSGAVRKAFLDLTHHSLHQHRWTAR